VRRIFRLLMAFAKERGYRKDNPAADIRKKKPPKGKKRGWATLGEGDMIRFPRGGWENGESTPPARVD
jgi:hypothetical protein